MKYLIAVALLAACCVAAAADDCKSCQSGSCSITSAMDGGCGSLQQGSCVTNRHRLRLFGRRCR